MKTIVEQLHPIFCFTPVNAEFVEIIVSKNEDSARIRWTERYPEIPIKRITKLREVMARPHPGGKYEFVSLIKSWSER